MDGEAVGVIAEATNNIPPAEFKHAYYDVIGNQAVVA